MKPVQIVGGGLAGSEAAWQLAERGHDVVVHEMRPGRPTPAHKTDRLAELVCSNTFKSTETTNAHGLLKAEMRVLGSLILEAADAARVPGGTALTVDRDVFSRAVHERLTAHPRVRLARDEVTSLPDVGIVATGPLTSDALASAIATALGVESLAFYDAIAPIVAAESINEGVTFRASRYGKETCPIPDSSPGSYLNCPLTREQYDAFLDALIAADQATAHEFDSIPYFEGCMPVEEIARRGRDTLRFGPMKPVGLRDPRTGQMPYAVVQLRQENLRADSYNLVGFQNHLKFADQARVLRLIPGLENARFLRYGQIHRNTYINGPSVLRETLQMKAHPHIFFAGQISGVEGYVESIATGLMAGLHAAALLNGHELLPPPRATAFGSLVHYITHADAANFQPANITFDLLPPLEEKIRDRARRHQL